MRLHVIAIFKTLLLIASILWGEKLAAQNLTNSQNISTAQGLSQGMVFDILQDSEGFIWVATKNGLNRYDGYGFKVFTNDPYNKHSLSSNTIVKLFEDSKGRIWAGTEDAGLNVYDKKSGKFFRFANKVSDTLSISGNAIRLIEELPDGRILIAVAGAGLNMITLPHGFFNEVFTLEITRLSLPNNADVYGMGKDKKGTMWIGSMDGAVYRFNPSGKSFIKLPAAQLLNAGYLTRDSAILINHNLFLFVNNEITPLFDEVKTGRCNLIFRPIKSLWENYHRELYYYDVAKWEAGMPVKWGLPLPKGKRIIYPFIIDRSGILWAGTVGYGLRKYNTAGDKFNALFSQNSVRWIIPKPGGGLYLGDFGYGWKILKDEARSIEAFKKMPGSKQIDNFIITRSGDYWLKNDHFGYFNYNAASGKLKAYPGINNGGGIGDKQPILEDSKGYIWLPGLGGNISRVHMASGRIELLNINTNNARPMLPKSITTSLIEDNQGTFWIGTQDGFARVAVSTIPGSAPQIKWFYNNSGSRNSLNYNHVSTFINDPAEPDKYLWIGTKGGGLNRLDKTTGDFFHLTVDEGLPDNVVYGILPDDDGNIWGSTNKGIFCLTSPKHNNGKWMFRNFTKAEGLQDDEFNTGAYAKLPDGNLAFGGVNGINIFNPKEILVQGYTPNVFITNIMVNNQSISAGDKTGVLQNTIEQSKNITLTYLQDILTLEFASLDFTASVQNKYRYQLVGVDKDWVESGTRRSATYVHLPSGKYVFKLQGSNSQGIWSHRGAEMKITVLPPWWRTWWAYSIYALIIVMVIRAIFKFSVNRAKLTSQLNFEKLEANRVRELDTVKTHLYTNITHEFRTPLTVILGMAQQVLNKPDENFGNSMNMIIRNGKSLLKLVNELLDLSKLETGKMQLQLVNGDVINFLRYITESFQSLAEGQQKRLHFLSDMDLLFVAYDQEKLRQIVVNLLSNAIKFTPEKGNIYITVSKNDLPGDESKLALNLKIKDTGIGVPEDQWHTIFDRFYQLDNSHTRAAGGTGIGLSLTRELVKLMQGDIAVKSPPTGANMGSEFTVTLPMLKVSAQAGIVINDDEKESEYCAAAEASATTLLSSQENLAPSKPLLLLVEDNADVVAYIASCLPDYKLAVGRDGSEGFEIARETIPDLIITDVMMPFVDGFQLVKQLRCDEYTSHIPIIMLTAKADIESKMEGLQQGVDAYLEKPFYKEELLIRIKKLLEMRKNLQQYFLRKAGINNVITVDTIIEDAIAVNRVEDPFIKKVREAVEDNVTNADFTVEQLCKIVFMSHSQLHRKLDALTGCSPNKFIRVIRLNNARELLKNPAHSISTVAFNCGYNDPGYFTRVFKQEHGVTPQEWRVSNNLVS